MTLDGKAVGPGSVTFAPVGETRNPATGAIDPSGNYTVKTNRVVGLQSGKYRASVVVFEAGQGQPGERLAVQPKMITPEKYSSVETSGLEFEVKPGSNTFDIPLTSK